MTTDVERKIAVDAFRQNEAFVLQSDEYPPTMQVAAVSWTVVGAPRTAKCQATNAAVAELRAVFPNGRAFVLGGHTAWQQDSRITRHLKLWASSARGGLSIPRGRRGREAAQTMRKKIKWFGSIELEGSNFDSVVAFMETEPASSFVFVPNDVVLDLERIVLSGWSAQTNGPPAAILRPVVASGGFVGLPVGAFDDAEGGLVAFARPDRITSLLDVRDDR